MFCNVFIFKILNGGISMANDKEAESKKRSELYKGIEYLGFSEKDAKKIFENFEDECIIEITAPQKESMPMEVAITQKSHTGRYKGNLYKPGNVIFNIREAVVSSMVIGGSVISSIMSVSISQPIIAILTIVVAVLSIADLGKIELEDDAVIILANLWKNSKGANQPIEIEEAYNIINQELENNKRDKLSITRYNDLLKDLEKLKTVKIIDNKIQLKEKVVIKYD